MVGKQVIVRTYSAGVHYGTLAAKDGAEVTLTKAKRIWQWDGRNDAKKPYTLNEVSLTGPGSDAKVSATIPEICILGVIEIIPCSADACSAIESAKWS